MNLIVLDQLTCDEGLYFRYISMIAKTDLDYTVVIESKKEEVDGYYKLLKEKGWFDFVDDIVLPEWRVDGIRIDIKMNYPRTIYTPHIRCENVPKLLGELKFMRKL